MLAQCNEAGAGLVHRRLLGVLVVIRSAFLPQSDRCDWARQTSYVEGTQPDWYLPVTVPGHLVAEAELTRIPLRAADGIRRPSRGPVSGDERPLRRCDRRSGSVKVFGWRPERDGADAAEGPAFENLQGRK